jgi:hypothetical protein
VASHTFCELTALLICARSEFGSTVPKKIDLYWFIPAFVKSSVGSDSGTTEDEGTACPRSVHRPDKKGVHMEGYIPPSPKQLTKGVAIFLEVVQKGLSNMESIPFGTARA